MALFGAGKKSAAQLLRASEWKDAAERDALLAQLAAQSTKPADFMFLLSHPDATLRQFGGRLVRDRAGPGMFEALLEEADEKPEPVRKFILRLTSLVPPETAIAALEQMIATHAPPAKQKIGWTLALELPPQFRARFVDLGIRSTIAFVRTLAIKRYLEDRAPGELPPETLLELAQDPDERIRLKVIEALENVEGAQVISLMIDRFLHDSRDIRQRAQQYLVRRAQTNPESMREPILAMLVEGDDEARTGAAQIFFSIMPPDQALLMILDRARDLLGWVRARILRTLKGFSNALLQATAQILAHPDPEMRTQGLVLAESFRDARLVVPIARLLKDPDWWIRILAADCLGQLRDEVAVDPLVAALEDQDTKWAALEALAKIGSPRALKAVVNQLRDPRPEVRLEAIAALEHFNDARLVAVLKQLVQQETSQAVVTRASEVLRRMSAKLHLELAPADRRTATKRADELERPLDRLLARARELGASDVHINVGEPPWMRVAGVVQRVEGSAALSAEETRSWLLPALDPRRLKIYEELGEIDLCHVIPEVGRYRANLFTERRGLCGSFRVIPNIPPTLQELRAPPHLVELLDFHQGIIVVSGPAGCGKSTTMTALVNLINETKPHHIITLEDPIELVHPVKTALINQREIGRHTGSFSRALRGALREDPDVIVVQELRDPETIRMALTAAETGHLVFTTLHTTSAIQTIDRLVDAFPPEEQQQVRMSLSESLKYVICQTLIPRADGEGRVAVFELLKGTLSVGNLIREAKTFQLPSLMQIGKSIGMRTVDMALEELLALKLITPEAAYVRAEKKELFEALL